MEEYLIHLSKQVSHALRHAPWIYELELDDEGWVSIDALLVAIHSLKEEWASLSETDLIKMIEQSSKKRHEVKDGRIGALYGHSIPQKLRKEPAKPPAVLYHGTAPEIAFIIAKEGLKPMGRQYIHLSTDTEMAYEVGRRKSKNSTILTIKAEMAYQNKTNFYIGNEKVWLADYIAPEYIESNDLMLPADK